MGLKQMEPVIKKIGNHTFAIVPFPAFKAANLSGRLTSVLGPVVGAFAPLIGQAFDDKSNGERSGDGLMNIDASEAAKALSGCSEIDGDKLESLMRNLLLGGHITVQYEDADGKKKTEKLDADLANELFCGEVQDMYVLCFYVIQLNFNGFFKRLAVQSGQAKSEEKTTRPII